MLRSVTAGLLQVANILTPRCCVFSEATWFSRLNLCVWVKLVNFPRHSHISTKQRVFPFVVDFFTFVLDLVWFGGLSTNFSLFPEVQSNQSRHFASTRQRVRKQLWNTRSLLRSGEDDDCKCSLFRRKQQRSVEILSGHVCWNLWMSVKTQKWNCWRYWRWKCVFNQLWLVLLPDGRDERKRKSGERQAKGWL